MAAIASARSALSDPYIRGRYHSFPLETVRASVAERVAAGVREVTLIAQDTGRWGEDLDEPSDTATLLGNACR